MNCEVTLEIAAGVEVVAIITRGLGPGSILPSVDDAFAVIKASECDGGC